MSAQTNILVKDDASTPVEHTLIPIRNGESSSEWRGNDADTSLDGQLRMQMVIEPVKTGWRVVLKTEVPVMETLGASGTATGYVAPEQVAYVIPVITTMFTPRRSTAADRANALKIHLCAVNGASSSTGTGLTGINAAGGAYLSSTLPGPLLFTQLVRPS